MTINHELQSLVHQHMHRLVDDGIEEGMQLCVYRHGQCIIDVTVGTKNDAKELLGADDLILVWSVSKGVTATAMHMLAERRLIDYDDPVARYWPEFGKHGKTAITIRHVLAHTAGIPDTPESTIAELGDWQLMCAKVADMPLKSTPGAIPAYHGITYGWPLGEVLRRVDGRTIAQFVVDEINQPLGIDNLFFGPPEAKLAHAARISHNIPQITGIGTWSDPARVANHPAYQRGIQPAANLMVNARSLARVYASLIGEGVDGVRLLPHTRVAQATSVQRLALDQTLGYAAAFGLGFWLGGINNKMPPRLSAFGHPGAGGSIGYADPESGIAIGFTKTRMHYVVDSHDTSRDLVKLISRHYGIIDT
jgi:CubicO group peptidase (beta-lactamase class C family)